MTDQEYQHVLAMHEEFKSAVLQKLEAGEKRMDGMDTKMSEQSEMLTSLMEKLSIILEIFEAAKGGFKALGWLGTGIKWIGGIAGALAAIWAFVQTIKTGGFR